MWDKTREFAKASRRILHGTSRSRCSGIYSLSTLCVSSFWSRPVYYIALSVNRFSFVSHAGLCKPRSNHDKTATNTGIKHKTIIRYNKNRTQSVMLLQYHLPLYISSLLYIQQGHDQKHARAWIAVSLYLVSMSLISELQSQHFTDSNEYCKVRAGRLTQRDAFISFFNFTC